MRFFDICAFTSQKHLQFGATKQESSASYENCIMSAPSIHLRDAPRSTKKGKGRVTILGWSGYVNGGTSELEARKNGSNSQ